MTILHEITLRTPPKRHGWDAPVSVRIALGGFTVFFLLIGANIATPLYPYLAEQLSLSSAATSLTFSSYVLALIAGLLAISHWSNFMGRRAVLVIAMVLGLSGEAVFMLSEGLAGLLAGRALQGLSVAFATGASAAAVRDLLPESPEVATRITLVASSGGVAAGPVFGGLLSHWGDPVLTPFVFHLVATAALLVPLVLLRALPAREPLNGRPRMKVLRPLRPTPPTNAKRIFWLTALTGFLSFSLFGYFLSLAPKFYHEVLGSSRLIAGLLSAAVLGSSAVSQLFTLKPRHRGTAGMAFMGLGIALVLLLGEKSMPSLFVGAAFIGLGQGTAFRTFFAYMAASVPLSKNATTISLMYVVTYLGSAIPVLGLGLAMDFFGPDAVPMFLASCLAMAAMLALWARFEQEPPRYVEVSVPEAEVDDVVSQDPPHV